MVTAVVVAAGWVLFPAVPAWAQEPGAQASDAGEQESDQHSREPLVLVPINVGLWPRVSINRIYGKRTHNYLSMGVGASGPMRVTGLQLGLGVSAVGQDVYGIQLAGLVSAAGDDVRGIQLAGLVSAAGDDIDGIQVSGLVSAAGGRMRGLQAAVLISAAGADVWGLQVGGLASANGGVLRGVQVGGLLSATSELRGAQVSGAMSAAGHGRGVQLALGRNVIGYGCGLQVAVGTNRVRHAYSGVQLALVNIGGDIHGAQIGLVNVANRVSGVQVGLVNVSSAVRGAPIGPVSWVRGEPQYVELSASTTAPISVAWRLGNEQVYSLLAVGMQPLGDESRMFVGGGTGVTLPVTPVLAIEPDVMLHYAVFDYDPTGASAWLGQLRVKAAYRLASSVTLFAGISADLGLAGDAELDALFATPDHELASGNSGSRVAGGLFAGARL